MVIALSPVTSSQIAAVGYDATIRELVIKFHSSGLKQEAVYSYDGVPFELARGLIAPRAPGRTSTGTSARAPIPIGATRVRVSDKTNLWEGRFDDEAAGPAASEANGGTGVITVDLAEAPPLGQIAWLLCPRLPRRKRRLFPSPLGRQCRQGPDAA
jgi:hypothetical protein